MGGKGITIHQADGANRLVINQALNSSQILVKLCRNGTEWLSPIGWSEEEKGTLLDCRSVNGMTELDIPAQFASNIQPDDTLNVQCPELALVQDVKWQAVTAAGAASSYEAAKTVSAGLLDRFKRKQSKPDVKSEFSETELRAQEAERVAASYKAKMDAAANAKAEAERKALQAAKEAEKALKLEMDRIAEMERAAMAFEEAERLKQDEMRRLENERRIEEERKAEEARRIEAARQREIAARKAAERKAAIERYQSAVELTLEERQTLSDHLTILEDEAVAASESTGQKAASLEKLTETLAKTEAKASRKEAGLTKAQAALQSAEQALSTAKLRSEEAKAENATLEQLYANAKAEHAKAQRLADEAIAVAEEKQARLSDVAAQKSNILDQLTQTASTLEITQEAHGAKKNTAQKRQIEHETIVSEIASLQTQMDELKKSAEQAKADQHQLNLKLETARQGIEELDAREISHLAVIKHLESGGDAEEIDQLDISALSNEVTSRAALKQKPVPTVFSKVMHKPKKKVKNRIKMPAIKTPKISKPSLPKVDMPKASVPKIKAEDLPVKQGVAALAVAAILGTGVFAAYQASNNPKPIATSKKPLTPKVASAVVETSAADLTAAETTKLDIPAIEIKAATPEIVSELDASETSPDNSDNLEAVKSSDVSIDAPTPSQPKKEAAIEKSSSQKPRSQLVSVPKPADHIKAETKAEQSKFETEAYVELTRDVQTRLMSLGFYNGDIDGKQTTATHDAIKAFKNVQDLPVNEDITGPFLNSLRRAGRAQITEPVQTVELEVLPASSLVINEPVTAPQQVTYYDATLVAEPSFQNTSQNISYEASTSSTVQPDINVINPPYVETIPEAQPVTAVTEPDPIAVASAPIISELSVVPAAAIETVEAKLIKSSKIAYPRAAERREIWVSANVIVNYDVDSTGKPVNVTLASTDYTGRMSEAFTETAIKAVEKYRFEPRTENGAAVYSSGHTKKVSFRAE